MLVNFVTMLIHQVSYDEAGGWSVKRLVLVFQSVVA